MSQESIPDEVKKQVDEIVARFNAESIGDPECFYVTRFRKNFLYLDRMDYGITSHVCRLQYRGKMNNWKLAIYKYSSERYDPNEWLFPGGGYVDGTIEGAMKAGLEAYS